LSQLQTFMNHLNLFLYILQYFWSENLTFSSLTPEQWGSALAPV
jgi:hypothetical protein